MAAKSGTRQWRKAAAAKGLRANSSRRRFSAAVPDGAPGTPPRVKLRILALLPGCAASESIRRASRREIEHEAQAEEQRASAQHLQVEHSRLAADRGNERETDRSKDRKS